MKYAFTTLAFNLGVSALAVQRGCTFTLTSSGGQSGIVGQLDDGQNRVGGGHPTGHYSINNGQITDSEGRGCILTPPTSQFQCDEGATPTGGFSIGNNGQVEYNGSPKFYACPATDWEYNIYTTPVSGQDKCVPIWLTASGCGAAPPEGPPNQGPPPPKGPPNQETPPPQGPPPNQGPPPEQGPPPQGPPPQGPPPQGPPPNQGPPPPKGPPPNQGPGKTCPTDLNGNYQYPHLIVPVSQSYPDKAYGDSYNGQISPDISTIFNFDVPSSYTGTCSLVFLFPEQSQLETSSYTFSGDGAIDFKQLSWVASKSTTYASQGSVETDFGVKSVTPGSWTVAATFPCPAGQTVSYELSAASGTGLTFFQDYNPSPIGLYITEC